MIGRLNVLTVGKADRLHAHHQLTEKMGHPLGGGAPADIHDPLPQDGGIDEGLTPERGGDPRITLTDVVKRPMGDGTLRDTG